jgi:hypothetical protein
MHATLSVSSYKTCCFFFLYIVFASHLDQVYHNKSYVLEKDK